MRDKLIFSLAILMFLIAQTSAVVINEFTVSPKSDWDNSGSISSSADEFIEIYNPENASIELVNWTIKINDSAISPTVVLLQGKIQSKGYKTLLKPKSSGMNLNGQILVYDNLNNLIDSVSYGNWDDGNTADNAPSGSTTSPQDECLARIPNGKDTNQDSEDFQKVTCTYNKQNRILSEEEQGLEATILGKIVMKILPRFIDFGAVKSPSANNPSLSGNITLNAMGSEEDVNIEITEVIGSPFDLGLKVNGIPANQSVWNLPCNLTNNTCIYEIVEAVPTLDVPSDFPPGPIQGTIVYTISGQTP